MQTGMRSSMRRAVRSRRRISAGARGRVTRCASVGKPRKTARSRRRGPSAAAYADALKRGMQRRR